MSPPTHIRQIIIVPNREELKCFEVLAAAQQKSTKPLGRAGPPRPLPQRGQALLVCMLASTLEATQVRAEVIRVFTAYRRGTLAPAMRARPG